MSEITLADFQAPIFQTSEQRRAETATAGFWGGFGHAINTEWIGAWAFRQFGGTEAADPNFVLSDDLYGELTKDLPIPFWEQFETIASEAQGWRLRQNAVDVLNSERELAKMGWGGFGLKMLANVTDPVAIAADLATWGAARGWVTATKAGRITRALRTGLIVAGTESGLEAYRAGQDPSRGASDVVYAAAASFAVSSLFSFVGSGIHDLLSARSSKQLREIAIALPDSIEAQEIAEAGFQFTTKGRNFYPGPFEPGGAFQRLQKHGVLTALAKRRRGLGRPEPAQKLWMVLLGEGIAEASSGEATFGRVRFSAVGRTGRSPLPSIRKAGRGLVEDVLPDKTGAPVNASASELATVGRHRTLIEFYSTANPAIARWQRRNGVRFWKRGNARIQFMEDVGRAVRRKAGEWSSDPDVNIVADKLRVMQKDLLQLLKDTGVKGFSEVTENAHFLTRLWSPAKIQEMTAQVGEANVLKLMAGSFLRQSDNLTEAQALQMAKAFKRHIVQRHWQSDLAKGRMLQEAQSEALEKMLREEIGDLVDEDFIQGMLFEVTKDSKTGVISRAKRRMNLDETFTLDAVDEAGLPLGSIAIEDLLENNAETIINLYARQAHGAIAGQSFLEAWKVKGLDVTAPTWQTVIDRITTEAKETLTEAQRGKFLRDIGRLENMWAHVTGRPMDKNAGLAKVLSRLRGINFVRVVGKFGVAQASEIGTLLGEGTWRGMAMHMPTLRKFRQLALDGKMKDLTLREIQEMTALGSDRMTRHLTYRHGDFGVDPERQLLSSFDRTVAGLQRAGGTVSGMNAINEFEQFASGVLAMQTFVDAAHGGAQISARRLKTFGLTPDMAERIFAELRVKGTTEVGWLGRKHKLANLNSWNDQEAAAKLVVGVNKWARRVVQQTDVGQMSTWMTTDMGRTLLQFRSFTIGAWEKQFLTGLYHRDFKTWASWSQSMMIGSLAYIGLTYSDSIGRPDRKEFLAKRLTDFEIGKAGFQRAGWSTLMPGMIDTPLWFTGRDPQFRYGRTSGLGTDIITGSPTGDLVMKSQAAVRGVVGAATRDDYQFSQQDWRNVRGALPYHTAFVIQNVLGAVGKNLPKRSVQGE